MTDSLTARLFPATLAQFVVESDQQQFIATSGGCAWLLVQLEPQQAELRAGLLAMEQADSTTLQPSLSVLGYDTVIHDVGPMFGATGAALSRPTFDAVVLRRLIERQPQFALPLRKRAGDAYADRISVGRARNKDVVLREESVSKFHAWFEMDEAGRFYLADAGSANGTRVAGRLLPPRELSPVAMGALIEFGAVRAALCPSEVFWRAFHPTA